jgi:hypothetical protein
MSDDNESGGIIGTIISLLILAVIWPYLLAILGLYIAYMAVIALLDWIAQNLFTVVLIIIGMLSFYAVIHYRLIPKAWRWMVNEIKHELRPKATQVDLEEESSAMDMPDLSQRKFIPSTNLYCYWCTKKLGVQAFEFKGNYYCGDCAVKLSK